MIKRSWPTYIAVFLGMVALIGVSNYVQMHVLDDESTIAEPEETPPVLNLISIALVFTGIHFVAMFAATPVWRRRSLYVTRLPWGLGAALGMLLVLFLLPDVAALLATQANETPNPDNVMVIGPRGGSPGSDVAQPPATGETPVEGASEDASPVEVTAPDAEETRAPGDGAATEPGDDVQKEDRRDEEPKAEPLTTLPQELIRLAVATVALLSFFFVARSAGRDIWRGLGFCRKRFWRHVGTGAAAYLAFTWALMLVAQTAIALVFERLGLPVEGHEAVNEFRETTLPSTRLALVLGITVRAPLFEEIVFRGVLFQTIKRYTGAWPAIVASAAVFAVLHGAWFVIMNIFFLGLLFGYLFDRTGSIVPCIVLHFLFNSTTAVFLILAG